MQECVVCVGVVRSQHRLFGGPVNREDGGPHGLGPQQSLCVCVCVCVRWVGFSFGCQPGRVGLPRPDIPDNGMDPAPPMDRVAYGLTVSHSDVRRSQRRYVLDPNPTHGRPWDPRVHKPRASLMVSVGSWPGKNVCLWDPTFPFARGRTPLPVAQLANKIPRTLLGT